MAKVFIKLDCEIVFYCGKGAIVIRCSSLCDKWPLPECELL